jgi:putative DNA methylase
MSERRGGRDNASLASSIFLVARRRETGETGEWSQVQADFERVVSERIHTLADMGITGADLVIASIGAGLGPYTAYKAVELPNGDPLEPEAFLDEVQTTVVKTILSDLMGMSRAGVEAVDPVTQLYVIGRFEYGDSTVPFDEMNTLVHGVLAGARGGGVELLGPRGLTAGAAALVEQEKDTMRLRDFEERGQVEELGQASAVSPNLIDVLHRLLWLAEHEPAKVGEYLLREPPDLGRLHLVAHALSGSGLSGKGIGTSEREQHAIQRLLASWKHLVEDNLFQSRS